MSRLALALAALGYGQSFYYKLGNTIQNYLDYSHEITCAIVAALLRQDRIQTWCEPLRSFEG